MVGHCDLWGDTMTYGGGHCDLRGEQWATERGHCELQRRRGGESGVVWAPGAEEEQGMESMGGWGCWGGHCVKVNSGAGQGPPPALTGTVGRSDADPFAADDQL